MSQMTVAQLLKQLGPDGLTRKRLQLWEKNGWVTPVHKGARGRGNANSYDESQVLFLQLMLQKVVKRQMDPGGAYQEARHETRPLVVVCLTDPVRQRILDEWLREDYRIWPANNLYDVRRYLGNRDLRVAAVITAENIPGRLDQVSVPVLDPDSGIFSICAEKEVGLVLLTSACIPAAPFLAVAVFQKEAVRSCLARALSPAPQQPWRTSATAGN